MPVVGAIAGAAIGAAAMPSLVVAGTSIPAMAVMGGIGGAFLGQHMQKMMTDDIPLPDETAERIREVDDTQGWASLSKRARGRRATILTSPQLAQQEAGTKKATLLAG